MAARSDLGAGVEAVSSALHASAPAACEYTAPEFEAAEIPICSGSTTRRGGYMGGDDGCRDGFVASRSPLRLRTSTMR